MEEIVNSIGADSSASKISDEIKDALFAKAASKIDGIRADVGASMFDQPEETQEEE